MTNIKKRRKIKLYVLMIISVILILFLSNKVRVDNNRLVILVKSNEYKSLKISSNLFNLKENFRSSNSNTSEKDKILINAKNCLESQQFIDIDYSNSINDLNLNKNILCKKYYIFIHKDFLKLDVNPNTTYIRDANKDIIKNIDFIPIYIILKKFQLENIIKNIKIKNNINYESVIKKYNLLDLRIISSNNIIIIILILLLIFYIFNIKIIYCISSILSLLFLQGYILSSIIIGPFLYIKIKNKSFTLLFYSILLLICGYYIKQINSIILYTVLYHAIKKHKEINV
ncbi:hypothetical protein G6646_00205 [Polynucleobacter paneuropaeus]|nr:hypothetical protein [Polynucleobacter paneuropaeus]